MTAIRTDTALDALDLAVESGAVYGYLGPNGGPGRGRVAAFSRRDLSGA